MGQVKVALKAGPAYQQPSHWVQRVEHVAKALWVVESEEGRANGSVGEGMADEIPIASHCTRVDVGFLE